MKRFFVGLFLSVLVASTLHAQSVLTLEDIYSNGTYGQKGYGPVRWMKDSKGYSTLETIQRFPAGISCVMLLSRARERCWFLPNN